MLIDIFYSCNETNIYVACDCEQKGFECLQSLHPEFSSAKILSIVSNVCKELQFYSKPECYGILVTFSSQFFFFIDPPYELVEPTSQTQDTTQQTQTNSDQEMSGNLVSSNSISMGLLLGIVGAVAVLVIAAVFIIFLLILRNQKKKKQDTELPIELTENAKVLSLSSLLILIHCEQPLVYNPDHWEIDYNELKITKELGRGAFGIGLSLK